MPMLTMKVIDRRGTLGGAGLDRRLKSFTDAEQRARQMAARAATTSTRSNFKYRRESIAPRPGRSSTGGQMKKHLLWKVDPAGVVEFDLAKADREVQHWIIQEIGTGERATIKRADQVNPLGRPKKGTTYVRTVRSQKGRRIKGGLVFASGGRYSPPGSQRDEQLHLASRVSGVPAQVAGIRISKEIEGQHFVKKGGQHGFREYQQSVLAAARQAFKKGSRS